MLFDPYYETKVNLKWGRLPIGSLFGFILITLGLMAFSFTLIDLTNGMTPVNNAAWQENSIWPTIGKGIWVGAILVATGIIGFISNRERTQVSLYVFNAFSWVSAIFSLYLLVSSILHIQPYILQGFGDPNTRTVPMSIEIIFNGLLLATGGLGVVFSLMAAILSCFAGNCCLSRRRYEVLVNAPYGPLPMPVPSIQMPM